MNIIERWRARRDPRRRQPFETPAIWQSRRLVERSLEHPPQLGPVTLPTPRTDDRQGPIQGARLVGR